MTNRDDILASVRRNRPQLDRPLPDVPLFDGKPRPLLLWMFKDSLQRMGGVFLDPPAAGDPLMPVRIKIAGAKIVCSREPEISGTRDVAGLGRPQDLPTSMSRSSAPPSPSPRPARCCSPTRISTSMRSPISRST